MGQEPDSARNASFVGSIPESYDRYLGPMLFHDYAMDLAARVRWPEGGAGEVLELAAGTGILTEQLAARMPMGTRLTATDLNPPMLALAERRMAGAAMAHRIGCQPADATTLPFADASFDAVVCQFGVMFFPDKVRALREVHRVLRPAGQCLFNVWGSWEENRFARVVNDIIASFFPEDPPTFYQVPFSLADATVLRALVLEAGFPAPEVTEVRKVASVASTAEAAEGLVRGNPVVTAIQERAADSAERIVAATGAALAREFGDRPLRFPLLARVVEVAKA
jgi:ubiquinone/menaquinone biosynthesis C-methylase UbiE